MAKPHLRNSALGTKENYKVRTVVARGVYVIQESHLRGLNDVVKKYNEYN